MPRRTPYAPQHRATSTVDPSSTPRRTRRRTTVALSGVAVAATGLAVSSGIAAPGAASGGPVARTASVASPVARAAASLGAVARRRDVAVSRSDSRTSVDRVKRRTLDQRPGGATTRTEDLTKRDPRTIARAVLAQYGFGSDQFSCLDQIYTNESGWNVRADNPSSSAYGIPQALPGSRMASAGADWKSNPATQITWGIGYIKARYGTPCSAWGFKQANGWY